MLAAVCQSVAFPDVLDALCNVQVCITDAIQHAGLSGVIQSGQSSPTERWLSSIRCKQAKVGVRFVYAFHTPFSVSTFPVILI